MRTESYRTSILRRLAIAGAVVLAAVILFSGIANAAAPIDQITVQTPRVESIRHLGRTSSGIPIDEISLSVTVTTEGLDLGTSAGLIAMEKRIEAAANSACRQISRDYPFTETSDFDCAMTAARPAIARVREAATREPG